MKKRLLAFFLALGILLSGCTVAGPAPTTVPTETTQATTEATQPTAPTEPEITHPALKFDELEYVHPDLDALNAKIDEAIAMASESGKEAELLNLYQEIQDDYVNYSTMATLASIHNYLDLQDEYYEQEYLDLDAAGTKLDNRLNDLTGAILDSEYADAARSAWGEDYVERYEFHSKLNSKFIETLSEREQALVTEYNKLLAQEYTTTLNGEEVTIDDLDLTTEEGALAYYDILERKNSELGRIYCKLVQIREKIATTLGYKNYTDYAYDNLGRDFAKEDAKNFSKQVKETLVPLFSRWLEMYREDMLEASGETDVSVADGVPYLREALQAEFPAEMDEALSYMLASGLYCFDDGENMMQAGFTTYMEGFHAPYLFINTGAYTDASTLFHEFGHYYNFYRMGDVGWNDDQSLDIAEIHSQGLELLMFDRYSEIYGDQADGMMLSTMFNILSAILSGCAEDEFQQKVYANPDMTLDQMNLVHGQIYQEYFGYPSYYEWVDIHHHFEQPLYYISYATSAVSALEIWEIAQTDRESALETYEQISGCTINIDYRDALDQAGLSDPFTTDLVERVAAALENWEMTGLNQADNAA